MNKRAAVFIDGNNFYFRLKDLAGQLGGKYRLSDFAFMSFSQRLVQPNQLVQAFYYIGALKRSNDPKSIKLYSKQQRLLGKLQAQGFTTVVGTIIQHPDGSFHEKGVDVRIAVEMIRLARNNVYDIAFLVSSDTDLVPAVEEVRSFGKEVVYVGTGRGQSFGLTKAANDVLLLRPNDAEPFLQPVIV
jgi:uncharacterized LabA/DUF88 family protein